MQSGRVLVVVPTYNERDNVGPLVRELVADVNPRLRVLAERMADEARGNAAAAGRPRVCPSQ